MKASPDNYNYLLKSAKMKYLQIPSILKLGRKGMTREREGREARGQEGKDQDAQHFNCTLNLHPPKMTKVIPSSTDQDVQVAQGCRTSTIFLGELWRRGALGEASNLPLVVILLQRPKFRQPHRSQRTPVCLGVQNTRNSLYLYAQGLRRVR